MAAQTYTDPEFNQRIDRIVQYLVRDQPVDQFNPYEVAAAKVFLKGIEAELAEEQKADEALIQNP